MRSRPIRLSVLVLTGCVALSLLLPGDAVAQRTVRWKMASAFTSGLDVVGESGPIFADNLKRMSGGTLDVKFFEPGALVPAFEVFNAVSKGSIESGWTTPGFHVGQIPAAPWFTTVPFGPQAGEFLAWLEDVERNYERYAGFLERGVSRELARIALPVNVYTEWYWKIDLHNLLHFLSLRLDEHAQQEIRDYAKAMFALVQPIVPIAAEAFVDYQLESMRLTRLEIEAVRSGQPLATENKREIAEWEQKRQKLGL